MNKYSWFCLLRSGVVYQEHIVPSSFSSLLTSCPCPWNPFQLLTEVIYAVRINLSRYPNSTCSARFVITGRWVTFCRHRTLLTWITRSNIHVICVLMQLLHNVSGTVSFFLATSPSLLCCVPRYKVHFLLMYLHWNSRHVFFYSTVL